MTLSIPAKLGDKIRDIYLMAGFRIALVAISLMVVIGIAPTTYTVLNDEAKSFAKILWNLMLCIMAYLYLGREIIYPAMKRPKIRPYAVYFSIITVLYRWLNHAFNGRRLHFIFQQHFSNLWLVTYYVAWKVAWKL